MQISQGDFLHVAKNYKKCPYCKNGHLDTRVKRGKFVKAFLFWLDLKRYSCSSCGRKAYVANKSVTQS